MKEEWLFHGAVVPIDVETTAALVAEIKRLIDVIGGMALAQPEQEPVGYLSEGGAERLLTKKQAHEHIKNFRLFTHDVPLYTISPQREFVGLTDEEITELHHEIKVRLMGTYKTEDIYRAIETKLKEKNHG